MLARSCSAGCAAPPRAPEPAAPRTYAFVLLGEEGRAVARVITPPASCPAIELDGVAVAMDVRARPATMPLRPTRSEPALSKPSAFPVLVCDKAIPAGVARASILGRALAAAQGEPAADRRHRRHRLPDQDGRRRVPGVQRFATQWPFAAVARAAAAAAPDLVIHVGDYHYRENACPAGNAQCAGSPWGYGWDAWEADVFAPARAAAAGGAVDRRARQPRVVQSRGPGLVAIPRSASAGAAAGLQRRGRRRDRRLQRAVCSAAGHAAATPTRSSSCSTRRSWASCRLPPDDADARPVPRGNTRRLSRSPRGGRTRSS